MICHHAEVGDHSFIAANSLIGGYTKIKNNCFIGFSSTILHKLTIENETLLAAGALMTRSSEPFSKYKGVPAKKYDDHKSSGIEIKD